MPYGASYHAEMPSRGKALKLVVGENVLALMKARNLKQQHVAALAKQRGAPIDQTTVGRIARAEIPTTVDRLHAIALGIGVQPWQLLIEGLDPHTLPQIGADSLPVDERKLLARYRSASGRWKVAIMYTAGLDQDEKQEEAMSYLLSKIFATPAADERVAAAYGKPGEKPPAVVHEDAVLPYTTTRRKKR